VKQLQTGNLNKQRYIALLQDPSSITKEDVPDLEELILQYPYCQNAHILLAKIQMLNGSMHAAKLTRKAALYTSDRNKLKDILSPASEPVVAKPLISEVVQDTIETVIEPALEKPILPEPLATSNPFSSEVKKEADKHAANFLDELENNLKELRESRARAAGILPPFSKEEIENINKQSEPAPLTKPESLDLGIHPTSSVSQQDVKNVQEFGPEKSAEISTDIPTPTISKQSDILDLILRFDDRVKDYFDINEYAIKKEDPLSSVKVDSDIVNETVDSNDTEEIISIPFDNNDWNLEESRMEETSGTGRESILLHYLDYIREQKNKKQKPDKKREKSIISRFIRKDPMISPLSPTQASDEDDDPYESGKSGIQSAFISETFALLLEKQGKIEKAIHVYEELILKNPEKNSYFATRIQELKKKNNLQ